MRTHTTIKFHEDDDEPLGESLLKPWAWFGALVVLALTATVQLRDLADNGAEWAQSQALKDAQQHELQAERRERAAQALCTSEHGPQVLAVWVDEDTLECLSPRGRHLSVTQEAGRAARP